ncbi:hypothetical protein [Consotaella salsifontis]|uniref:Uncharacterized protein n=1 Tax=Consotaella salsifontis TaxID=1365950 RepID=A0A1T4RW37_9HYPH|nr:hypothetical protein [Consotaella salsifontis]SKA19958.1 hypothetical protein SAMN05428963_1088 [Consotaella salsifontis]
MSDESPPEPFGLNDEQRAGTGWMVIGVDNFNRDSVDDFILCRDVRSGKLAERIANAMNDKGGLGGCGDTYWRAVPHDHKLHRGMWDLI